MCNLLRSRNLALTISDLSESSPLRANSVTFNHSDAENLELWVARRKTQEKCDSHRAIKQKLTDTYQLSDI